MINKLGNDVPQPPQMMNKSRQNDVAKKVRKSYEQLAFKERKQENPLHTERNKQPQNNRYLSVGFHTRQTSHAIPEFGKKTEEHLKCQEYKKTGSVVSTTNDTFKKSDASSFTQISAEFQNTKNSNDTEKENAPFGKSIQNSFKSRIGEENTKRRQFQSNQPINKIMKRSTEQIPRDDQIEREKLVLPTINTSRKFTLFDASFFTNLQNKEQDLVQGALDGSKTNRLHKRQNRAM